LFGEIKLKNCFSGFAKIQRSPGIYFKAHQRKSYLFFERRERGRENGRPETKRVKRTNEENADTTVGFG
jgi:hypothetical protein